MNERQLRIATIEEFGSLLLSSGDLDPLYIALVGAGLERDQLRRWLFAYWCCYNAGASSWLSELSGDTYWTWMRIMAENDVEAPIKGRWPRGHERRHFRGEKAVKAVEAYAEKFRAPESICAWFEDETLGTSFLTLRRKVTSLPQFGPWIAFKVGDMLERVIGVKVDFADADVMMFEQPYKSALEVWNYYDGSAIARSTVSEKEAVRKVVQKLQMELRVFQAPPRRDRGVGIQEIETILCKWKSHNNGSYPMGLDSRELRHGLHAWSGASKTAERLLSAAPAEGR